MRRAWVGLSVVVSAAVLGADGQGEIRTDPRPLLRSSLRLADDDMSDIERGRAVVRTLSPDNRREVITAGAIRIAAPASRFVDRFRTLEGFRTSQFVRQIARFSNPPVPSDLDPLVLDDDDLDDLRDCRLNDCGVRLTAGDIPQVAGIDWRAPEAESRVAALYKSILFRYLSEFREGGLARLPVYLDQEEPLSLGDELDEILSLPSPLDGAPAIRRYIESFPDGVLPDTESFFYWSKEAFGFKPVIGLYHVVMHTSPEGGVFILTTQIYASHYMDGQVSLSVVWPVLEGEGFYWLYFNRARIGRLDSFMGRLSKSIVQRRTRSGLSRSMTQTRERMESREAP